MNQHAKASVLAASIVSLSAKGELALVQGLATMLLEVLEDGTIDHRDLNPENVSEPVAPDDSTPLTPAQRAAAYRRRKRAGVTPAVTERHAGVTASVTPPLSDLPLLSAASPPRPLRGLGEEAACSSSQQRAPEAVTTSRDGVTLMLPTEPDAELRRIFAEEVARRGVELELDYVWRKFQRHGYEIRSRGHIESLWLKWCGREEPRKAAAPPPAASEPEPPAPPAPPVEEPAESNQERPGPRSAPLMDAELSRRLEAERLERLAREAAELREAHERRWGNQRRDIESVFTPEALGAARRAS